MKLGCVDHAFPLLGRDQVCRLIALLGLETIDFALWGGGPESQLARALRDIPATGRELRGAADSASLEISDLFVLQSPTFDELALNHPDPNVREESRRLFDDVLDLATRLQVPGVTILPGIDWPEEHPQESLERAAGELVPRLEAARAAGFRLSVEPHIGSVITTPERTAELLDRVPGLELTLDYSHFVFAGISQPEVDPLLARARHLHARGARPERLQTPAARNTIDFAAVVRSLPAGYDGVIALEYLWADIDIIDPCDNVAEIVQLAGLLRAASNGDH